MEKINVGVVGCGNISGIYFANLTGIFGGSVKVFACADLIEENAIAAAEKYGIPRIMTLDEMLGCRDIQAILNLTTPLSHYSINKQALLAGKHVYCEKPLSITFEEGAELCRIAKEKGLLLGCAPDTFMGAGIQTCRRLIDEGKIGRPVGGNAFMLCHGHESWHPNPAFYYKKGAGPMFDMGPYYLTALVNLLGPVSEIATMNGRGFETRTITSQPRYGEEVAVEVQTHVCGLLRFVCGAVVHITTSFDVWAHSMPNMELYGSDGSIEVPDPNGFGGPVRLAAPGKGFEEVPLSHGFSENSRGIGVANMAACILGKSGDFRANQDVALHVLEAMCAMTRPGSDVYRMQTRPKRTAPLEVEYDDGVIF